jgi:hypothetical protein
MASNTVSCNSYNNIPYACLGGPGSIQKAWICPWEGFSFTTDATGLTLTITGFTSLYELQPYKSSSKYTQEQSPDPTVVTFKQTIEMHFPGYKTLYRNMFWSTAQTGSGIVCIILTREGQYLMFGSENGLLSGMNSTGGATETDKKETIVTLTGSEATPALEVTASIMVPYTVY